MSWLRRNKKQDDYPTHFKRNLSDEWQEKYTHRTKQGEPPHEKWDDAGKGEHSGWCGTCKGVRIHYWVPTGEFRKK